MPTPHSVVRFLSASPQSLWDLRHARRPADPVSVEQPQLYTAIAYSTASSRSPCDSGAHHMAPDLLFYPVLDEHEALACVCDRKVIAHPLSIGSINCSTRPTATYLHLLGSFTTWFLFVISTRLPSRLCSTLRLALYANRSLQDGSHVAGQPAGNKVGAKAAKPAYNERSRHSLSQCRASPGKIKCAKES